MTPPVTRRGDTGAAVAEIRDRLGRLGLLPSAEPPVDPASMCFDDEVDVAVRAFQQQRGLTVDGIVGPQTFRRLEEARWSIGDRVLSFSPTHLVSGDDVLALQQRLSALGFDLGRVDGRFGTRTDTALREFQSSVGVDADGTCGPETFRALARLARTMSGGGTGAGASAMRELHALESLCSGVADKVVVIDPGHGGEDPGAIGPSGLREKDVVLSVALQLRERLNALPGLRVMMTRDADFFVPLHERVKKARRVQADLFVSIHADSVRDHSITGASVYTLSYHGASSEAARRLADRENATVLKGGVSLADVNPALASVLLDAAQSQIMGASVEAADQVLGALDDVGAVRKKAVQHAGFMVLKSPDVPSMLVETAYISNPSEERKLRSASYQEQLARAIESGVVNYFQHHPPDGTNYANRRRDGDTVESDSGV